MQPSRHSRIAYLVELRLTIIHQQRCLSAEDVPRRAQVSHHRGVTK